MTINKEAARAKATATYNAASDHYDEPALSFWDRYGSDKLIEQLRSFVRRWLKDANP